VLSYDYGYHSDEARAAVNLALKRNHGEIPPHLAHIAQSIYQAPTKASSKQPLPGVTQRLYSRDLTGAVAPRNPCISLDQCLCLPVHACRILTHSGGATNVPLPHADAVPQFPVHSLLRDWSYEVYAILQLMSRETSCVLEQEAISSCEPCVASSHLYVVPCAVARRSILLT